MLLKFLLYNNTMSIKDWVEKIKFPVTTLKERFGGEDAITRFYTAGIVVLVGLSAFGLGRLSVIDESREPIVIEEEAPISAAEIGAETQTASVVSSAVNSQMSIVKSSLSPSSGKVVASKNGTKYYFPWCGGITKIANANKVWFASEAEAKAKGYAPAGNCKGLK